LRAPSALALFCTGCAQLAGVDDYAVTTDVAPADPAAVMAFLRPGADDPAACESCIARACAPQARACAVDAACGSAAACMSTCSDPGCLLSKCRGAFQPPAGSRLGLLSDCATTGCLEECSIGKSWGCSGKYSWPPIPNAPFNYSMAFDLFNTPDALAGAPVSICDYGAECLPRPSPAYTQSTGMTGQDGSVQLLVKPVAGASGLTLPSWFLQIQPSARNLAHRFEAPSGLLRPLAEAPRLPVFPEPFEFPPVQPRTRATSPGSRSTAAAHDSWPPQV
jgi:hypothetical protein